jgi:hypothetical protein
VAAILVVKYILRTDRMESILLVGIVGAWGMEFRWHYREHRGGYIGRRIAVVGGVR